MSVWNIGEGNIIKDAWAKAGIKSGARVLDAGCGEGATCALLAELLGAVPTGIDISDEMISRAKEAHPDLDFRKGEADFMEFESLSFDVVIMECVLSAIKMQEEALHEAYCVLRLGGTIIITDLCKRADGINDLTQIKAQLAEIGFTVTAEEDRTTDLESFAAEKIMEHGSLEAFVGSSVPEGEDPGCYCGDLLKNGAKGVGYYMIIAKKTA
jgi:ubiquinone/menaquinone biosynthesis C-methylase UbiE